MLAVSETGAGRPLVLLHGWGLHSGVWQSVLPELEKQFRCYTVDMLGHGESQSKNTPSFSLDNMRQALQQFISSIDSDDIILLGWSLGGLVALDYLSGNNVKVEANKIKKLILVTSNACFCKKQQWPYGLDSAVLDSFAAQLEQDYKKTVDKFMALQMFGADDYKQSLKILKASIASRAMPSIDALRQGLSILKTTDLVEQLHSIKQTVLMITAEHDRLMPYQAADAMQALFKNAEVEMIEGAGHAPFISHPKQFMQVINKYITE